VNVIFGRIEITSSKLDSGLLSHQRRKTSINEVFQLLLEKNQTSKK
jgi:hypothetical protein